MMRHSSSLGCEKHGKIQRPTNVSEPARSLPANQMHWSPGAYADARDPARKTPRETVERAVTEYGFRGIKLHGHDALPTREVCEAALAFGLPLLADVVGRAYVVEMLASEFPRLNFIIPHLGSFNDDWRAQQQVVDQLVRYPNVYADTSGVRCFDYIVQAVTRAGPHKLLFGSDGPHLHPGVELYKIRMLRLPVECEKLILGGNAARLVLSPHVGRRQAGCPSDLPKMTNVLVEQG